METNFFEFLFKMDNKLNTIQYIHSANSIFESGYSLYGNINKQNVPTGIIYCLAEDGFYFIKAEKVILADINFQNAKEMPFSSDVICEEWLLHDYARVVMALKEAVVKKENINL